MSRKPIVKRCLADAGCATRRALPLALSLPLSLSLLWSGPLFAQEAASLAPEVSAQAVAIVSKNPPPVKPKGKSKLAAVKSPEQARKALLPSPTAVLSPQIVPKHPNADRTVERSIGQHRSYVEVSGLGLLIGDYQLQPRLVLGTDNRLDDVNIRERVLRDEMDYMEARRRGELKVDPITVWLRSRGQGGIPGVDPGFQVAYAIQRMLRGSIRLPPMLDYKPPPPAAYGRDDKH